MAASEDISAGEWIDSGDIHKFVFCVNGVYMYIYEGSLIKVTGVDAIANPTNPYLGHGGGVSASIAKAAGQAVIDACEGYVKDFGHVRVKETFVSPAGNLPYKGIIHTVGPQWGDYSGQLTRCARHLYTAVINVLTCACSQGWKSVAIPAISSGGAGIPKRLCAEMYVKALIDFPISGQSGIKEIHIVDKNREMIEMVCETYEETFEKPSLLTFENAENYPGPPRKQKTDEYGKNSSQTISSRHRGRDGEGQNQQPNPFTKPSHGRAGGSRTQPYTFTIGSLKTLIYSESITQITGMDGIVNSTIETLEHKCGVALDISKAAGYGVLRECNDHVKNVGKLKVTQNFVSSGGNLSCSGIIHAVGPQWGNYKDNRNGCANDLRQTVVNALHSARKSNWRKIAMTAMSSRHSGVPKDLCATEYINALAEFAKNGAGSLAEVHFIDKDKDILDLVINAHQTWV